MSESDCTNKSIERIIVLSLVERLVIDVIACNFITGKAIQYLSNSFNLLGNMKDLNEVDEERIVFGRFDTYL